MPVGLSDYEVQKAGFFFGVPRNEPIGPVDPPERFIPREQPKDIWEDKDGIRSLYQSRALLLSEPMLWLPVTEWRRGKKEADDDKSNFWEEAVFMLEGTHLRSLRPKKRDDGD